MSALAMKSPMNLSTGCQTARRWRPVQLLSFALRAHFELNQVDIAYKSDLREMNELNYARFEAKLDQRLAEFRAELKGDVAELRTELKGDIAGQRTELNERFDRLRLDVNSTIGGAATDIQKAFKEQYKVFFLAWATLFVGVLGAIIPLYFR
jgi:hypothetical protein